LFLTYTLCVRLHHYRFKRSTPVCWRLLSSVYEVRVINSSLNILQLCRFTKDLPL
jgi:hypothetical protein